MHEHERHDLLGLHKSPAFVDQAHLIGVPIVEKSHARARRGHEALALIGPRLHRIGMDGIPGVPRPAMQFCHLYAGHTQCTGEIPACRTVHGVTHHLEVRIGYSLDIDKREKVGQVGTHYIDRAVWTTLGNGAGRYGIFQFLVKIQRADAAIGYSELNAQVVGSMMGPGDHDAAAGAGILRHRPGKRRHGRIRLGKLGHKAPSRQDPCYDPGVRLGLRPGIIGNIYDCTGI